MEPYCPIGLKGVHVGLYAYICHIMPSYASYATHGVSRVVSRYIGVMKGDGRAIAAGRLPLHHSVKGTKGDNDLGNQGLGRERPAAFSRR